MNKASRDDITRILGRIDDVKLAAVMALEPTRDEVIQAKIWLARANLRETGASQAPSGKVGCVNKALRTDSAQEWDKR